MLKAPPAISKDLDALPIRAVARAIGPPPSHRLRQLADVTGPSGTPTRNPDHALLDHRHRQLPALGEDAAPGQPAAAL
ncbi:hypothetical protein GCM10010324_13120 [Streptomyces hiroshimensis]|uniref:Uncharacterized protein n=1 Tax=Streptomyces hiroshimensis TaxID=66424 RepID=A0ABQ2Y7E2_9ACTN|nr:hypothetical protein GCM10010324_13120 [Streptomyces hiroshimensis]